MNPPDTTPPRDVRLRCQAALTSQSVREEIATIARRASGWQQFEAREGESFREGLSRQRANEAQNVRFGQAQSAIASSLRDACYAHYADNPLQEGVRLVLPDVPSDARRNQDSVLIPALSDVEMCALQELGMLPQHIPLNQASVSAACPVNR